MEISDPKETGETFFWFFSNRLNRLVMYVNVGAICDPMSFI